MPNRITSRENDKIKYACKLARSAAFRGSENAFFAEGLKLCTDLAAACPLKVIYYTAAALEKTFPLLEHIEVERVYPSTVVVRVTPATPVYAMEAPGGWVSLSADLKILSAGTEQPELPILYGGDPVSTTPGDQLSYLAPEPAADSAAGAAASSEGEPAAAREDGKVQTLETLLDALEARGLLAEVTRVEFADVEQLAFLYQDRISVLLGTLNELDYKLDYAEYMLLNKEGKGCAATDTGKLDCSHLRTDGSLQAIFAQGDAVMPSGYTAPQAVPEVVPEPEEPGAPETALPAQDGGDQAAAEPAPDQTDAPDAETPPAGPQQEEGL